MGLSQQWMSQKHSRWFPGGKDRLVIKPHGSGRLTTGEQRARKGEGRKAKKKEAGNQLGFGSWRFLKCFSHICPSSPACLRSSWQAMCLCLMDKAVGTQETCALQRRVVCQCRRAFGLAGLDPAEECGACRLPLLHFRRKCFTATLHPHSPLFCTCPRLEKVRYMNSIHMQLLTFGSHWACWM